MFDQSTKLMHADDFKTHDCQTHLKVYCEIVPKSTQYKETLHTNADTKMQENAPHNK